EPIGAVGGGRHPVVPGCVAHRGPSFDLIPPREARLALETRRRRIAKRGTRRGRGNLRWGEVGELEPRPRPAEDRNRRVAGRLAGTPDGGRELGHGAAATQEADVDLDRSRTYLR